MAGAWLACLAIAVWREQARFDQIQPGMTRAEVVSILGKESKMRWYYGLLPGGICYRHWDSIDGEIIVTFSREEIVGAIERQRWSVRQLWEQRWRPRFGL